MLPRRTAGPLIASLATAFVASSSSAQVNAIEIFRVGVFDQTSIAPPTTSIAWTTIGRVLVDYADDLFSADLLCASIGLNEPLTYSGRQWLWYSPNYDTRSSMEAALPPNAAYVFDLFGPAAIGQTSLSSASQFYADHPPHFSGDTYERLQGVNPNTDISIQVAGYEPVPGANEALIFLDIYDLTHGGFAYFDQAASSNSTTFVVPAATLLPNTDYVVRAIYSSRRSQPDAAFVTATKTLAFDLNTELRFFTRACVADLDGIPGVDLNDFFTFFNCWDLSLPCADLDGNPGVDLGDFFAFFNGFDEGC